MDNYKMWLDQEVCIPWWKEVYQVEHSLFEQVIPTTVDFLQRFLVPIL